MTEADPTQRWYCLTCDREWDFAETKTKVCPECHAHGVRSDDLA